MIYVISFTVRHGLGVVSRGYLVRFSLDGANALAKQLFATDKEPAIQRVAV